MTLEIIEEFIFDLMFETVNVLCRLSGLILFIILYVMVDRSGEPKGGKGGPDPPPTFQKVGPRDSHKNVIKLVGGGIGPIGQICQEMVSEILKKQAENGFFKNWSSPTFGQLAGFRATFRNFGNFCNIERLVLILAILQEFQ